MSKKELENKKLANEEEDDDDDEDDVDYVPEIKDDNKNCSNINFISISFKEIEEFIDKIYDLNLLRYDISRSGFSVENKENIKIKLNNYLISKVVL